MPPRASSLSWFNPEAAHDLTQKNTKMILPLLIFGGLVGGAAYAAKKRAGMTPERQKIFEAALSNLKDPIALRKLADEFEKAGLKSQAELLRKRAALRELPPETKVKRREAFRAGMASVSKSGVESLANAFAKEGATGAATALRNYAQGLGKK
jgi:hypothetical protein